MAQNRFRQLREEHGLSQIELGNRLGVTQQSVFAWEHGKATPAIQTAIQLSQLYDVSLDYLMGLSDTPKMQEPVITDDELRISTYNRIKSLPEPVLARVLDLIDAIQAVHPSAPQPDPAADSELQALRGSSDQADP